MEMSEKQNICKESGLVGGQCSNKLCIEFQPHKEMLQCSVGCNSHKGIQGATCIPYEPLYVCDHWQTCADKNCQHKSPSSRSTLSSGNTSWNCPYHDTERWINARHPIHIISHTPPQPTKETQTMDTCKTTPGTSSTPTTKLTITKPFCPFDLITAHHAEYHGVSCTAWRNDLDWLLQAHGVNQLYDGLDALQLDRPDHAQLRRHLVKWGFVRETPIEQILDVTVEKRDSQRWVVHIRTNKEKWAICSITPDGLRRYDGIYGETAFKLEDNMIHIAR